MIELLTVISIIALLTSIVLASLSVARQKAEDANKMETVRSVENALGLYYSEVGSMPPNSYDLGGAKYGVAIEDTAYPTNPLSDPNTANGASGNAYNTAMNYLVAKGLFPAVPHSTDPTTPYGYFNFGSGPNGAMFGTTLTTGAVSSNGLPQSCHPSPPTVGICEEADLNNNGKVNQDDFGIWNPNFQQCEGITPPNWGSSGCNATKFAIADLNHDGVADQADADLMHYWLGIANCSTNAAEALCAPLPSQDYCLCVPE